jgi:hypothetical protein
MKLVDLDACFVRRHAGPPETWEQVDELADADGVMFLCPKCYAANSGEVGTHRVLCWFVGHVSDDVDPKPGRWVPAGTGLDDLTFVGPAAASVQLTGGCGWHGFVKNGDAAVSLAAALASLERHSARCRRCTPWMRCHAANEMLRAVHWVAAEK